MPLFEWQCTKCGTKTRKILPRRPHLGKCCCSGDLTFLTKVSSVTKEVIDNGLMYKALERDADAEEKLKERNSLAEKPDDPIV